MLLFHEKKLLFFHWTKSILQPTKSIRQNVRPSCGGLFFQFDDDWSEFPKANKDHTESAECVPISGSDIGFFRWCPSPRACVNNIEREYLPLLVPLQVCKLPSSEIFIARRWSIDDSILMRCRDFRPQAAFLCVCVCTCFGSGAIKIPHKSVFFCILMPGNGYTTGDGISVGSSPPCLGATFCGRGIRANDKSKWVRGPSHPKKKTRRRKTSKTGLKLRKSIPFL